MNSIQLRTSFAACLLFLLGAVQFVAAVNYTIELPAVQDKFYYATYQTGIIFGKFVKPFEVGTEGANYKLTLTNGKYEKNLGLTIPDAAPFIAAGRLDFPIYRFVDIPKEMLGANKITLTYNIINSVTKKVISQVVSESTMPVSYHEPYSPDQVREPNTPGNEGHGHKHGGNNSSHHSEPSSSGSDEDEHSGKKPSSNHDAGKGGKSNKSEQGDKKDQKPIPKDEDKSKEEENPPKSKEQENGVFEIVSANKLVIALCVSGLAFLLI